MVYFLRASNPSGFKMGMGELMDKINWWVVLAIAVVLVGATVAWAYVKRPEWLTMDKLDDNGKRKVKMMKLTLVCIAELILAVLVGVVMAHMSK